MPTAIPLLAALVAIALGACGGKSALPDSSPLLDESPPSARSSEPPSAPPAVSDLDAGSPDAEAPEAIAEPARAPFEQGATITVPVPGDKDVLVVHGAPGDRRALLYLHGKCGDVRAFGSWADAASRHGTLAALVGDEACPGGHRWSFTRDLARLDRRVTSAIRAASEARGEPLDDRSVTLLGYSGGASRAASLASKYPERYPRLILVAAPSAPTAGSLSAARAIVLIAGGRDRQEHLRSGAEAMARAGRPATFMLLPGAAHGEYGPEASRVMGDALAWAFARAPYHPR
jgi:predicted esterase